MQIVCGCIVFSSVTKFFFFRMVNSSCSSSPVDMPIIYLSVSIVNTNNGSILIFFCMI